jgi:hypothetical protein
MDGEFDSATAFRVLRATQTTSAKRRCAPRDVRPAALGADFSRATMLGSTSSMNRGRSNDVSSTSQRVSDGRIGLKRMMISAKVRSNTCFVNFNVVLIAPCLFLLPNFLPSAHSRVAGAPSDARLGHGPSAGEVGGPLPSSKKKNHCIDLACRFGGQARDSLARASFRAVEWPVPAWTGRVACVFNS